MLWFFVERTHQAKNGPALGVVQSFWFDRVLFLGQWFSKFGNPMTFDKMSHQPSGDESIQPSLEEHRQKFVKAIRTVVCLSC